MATKKTKTKTRRHTGTVKKRVERALYEAVTLPHALPLLYGRALITYHRGSSQTHNRACWNHLVVLATLSSP